MVLNAQIFSMYVCVCVCSHASSYCTVRFQISNTCSFKKKKKILCGKKLLETQKTLCSLGITFIQNRLYCFLHQFKLYLALQ